MNGLPAQSEIADRSIGIREIALQSYLLQGVSRTFALTIPQLPEGLCQAVSNAYLLCRIVDTIEDEATLSQQQKRSFCFQFERVVTGDASARAFARELAPLLSPNTIPAEHELIRNTPAVIGITHSLNRAQRGAIEKCIHVMAYGMASFQKRADQCGLADMAELDRYCYHVAGVVGEMLTELFCDYSPGMVKSRDTLMRLAVSFGQGLQMTNILKDIWDDYERGACWLPRDIFNSMGCDLTELRPGDNALGFSAALGYLIGVAYEHLRNALTFTLLIPKQEAGIRNFCLWAIGMAVLTLRKINRHRDFSSGREVKITRRTVKTAVAALRLAAANDSLLKAMCYVAGIGLPRVRGPIVPVSKVQSR